MVVDIEDANSIPPEFLDNAFFRQIMRDAITEIGGLRYSVKCYQASVTQAATPTCTTTTYNPAADCYMYTGTPVTTGIGTQNTTPTPMPYTTYPTTVTNPVPVWSGSLWQMPQVSATMIYSEMDKNRLADQAVERAVEQAAAKDEPPPTVEEKDRLWDLIKSSVEGGGC
jgi:hypothetical protein